MDPAGPTVAVRATDPPGLVEPTEVASDTVDADRISTVICWLALCAKASATRTVTVELLPAVGMPESRPLSGSSANPAGRVPAVIDQANGAVPPVTLNWSL